MYKEHSNVDVLLLLEHKDRELNVVIEIARLLKSKYGLSIAVASLIYDKLDALTTIHPKVVVFPSNGEMANMFLAKYQQEIVYINLNLEQMISIFNSKYRKPRDAFSRSVLKHCAWGSSFREFLIENNVNKSNIFITGKPAVKLLQRMEDDSEKVRSDLSIKYGLDPAQRWIFIPLTCLHAFSSDKHARGYVAGDVTEELAFQRRDYAVRTINELFHWIVKAASDNSEIQFILRPHPSVSVEQYNKKFEELTLFLPKNIYISKDEIAHHWLLASECCYTNYSSLVLDALILKKPGYLLEPEKFPDYLSYQWFDLFPHFRSEDEFLLSLKGSAGLNMLENNSYILLNEIFDMFKDAAAETSKLINDHVETVESFPKGSNLQLILYLIKSPRQLIGSILRTMLMTMGLKGFVKSGLVCDYFTSSEIDRRLHDADGIHQCEKN